MQITLARALKEKNRLIGKIGEFRKNLPNNVYNTKDVPKEDLLKIYQNEKEIISKVINLKSKISEANAKLGVYEKIYEIDELKILINYLNILETDTTPIRKVNPVTGNEDVTERSNFIDYEFKKNEIEKLQNRINQLQDEVDEINALNKIDVEL